MSRASRFSSLLRQAWSLNSALPTAGSSQATMLQSNAAKASSSSLVNALRHVRWASGTQLTDAEAAAEVQKQYGHATGLEKYELEGTVRGIDVWEESWLTAPFKGTVEDPVVVPSVEASRIVGVPDPDDDSLVWWGIIEDGNPPMQIIEGGEYFVLKRLPGGDHH